MIRLLRTFTLTLLLAGVAASVATADAFPGPGSYTHGIYTSNGDVYSYGLYVPSSYRSGQHVPLVVMIHGCNTPADVQALTVEYDSLAEQHDFIVLYPNGDAADLAAFHCWKAFWAPGLEGRDKGDAAAIAGMTRTVMSAQTIDPARIYAIGMSSGAFETAVLGAEYPDLYAAIGIHSGAAFMHGENGCFVTPYAPTFSTDSLASDAYTAEGPRARLVPAILFHGDNDHIVPYQCGQQALAQWLQTDNDVLSAANAPTIPTAPAATMYSQSGGYAYTVGSYQEPDGCTIAQFWTIHGMDHTWWPSASAASWAFFSAHRLTPPGAASPCVNTSPPGVAGSAVSAPPPGKANKPACSAAFKFTYHVHASHHARVIEAVVYLNGRKLRTFRGHALSYITISKPKQTKFTIKIVTAMSAGGKVTSTRAYTNCTRTPVKHTAKKTSKTKTT